MIGTTLDSLYRLDRTIGEGGMGTVYEATQLRLNKRVAVKVMARDLSANKEALARFRREAEITSQLGHPHIVQTLDFGTASEGEPYLVMEFLDGEDLEHRLRRVGKLPLERAAKIVRQVASALAATHAKGVVHRDLKPANIFLLEAEGTQDFAKVLDFGISKAKAAATKLTRATAIMGTPHYMAPEQAQGRIDEIESRTDQWALGCIAYEMLAGRPPFVGEDIASLLYQVIHQEPPPLDKYASELPAKAVQAIARSLSKDIQNRFATVAAFARELESSLSDTVLVASTPVSRSDKAPSALKNLAEAVGARLNALAGKIQKRDAPDASLPRREPTGSDTVHLGALADREAKTPVASTVNANPYNTTDARTMAADAAMFVSAQIAAKPTTFSHTAGEITPQDGSVTQRPKNRRKHIAIASSATAVIALSVALVIRSPSSTAPAGEPQSTFRTASPAPRPASPPSQPDPQTALQPAHQATGTPPAAETVAPIQRVGVPVPANPKLMPARPRSGAALADPFDPSANPTRKPLLRTLGTETHPLTNAPKASQSAAPAKPKRRLIREL
ncbi:MAG: protein kinase [Deltaproteobacteria bacterium]|nr:protein kinase [Deltaproteobacteria bacterium]